MNILFFLTPKSDVAYIYDNYSLRQVLEKQHLSDGTYYEVFICTGA